MTKFISKCIGIEFLLTICNKGAPTKKKKKKVFFFQN